MGHPRPQPRVCTSFIGRALFHRLRAPSHCEHPMDAISAPAANSYLDGCLRPPPSAHDAHSFALDAASAGPDLGGHIAELADEGRLGEFLDQTRAAAGLAGQTPFLREQLDPALGVIRDALSGLDA